MIRHAGDLGNVVADDAGAVDVNIIDEQIPLTGVNSIIGRSIVVSQTSIPTIMAASHYYCNAHDQVRKIIMKYKQ